MVFGLPNTKNMPMLLHKYISYILNMVIIVMSHKNKLLDIVLVYASIPIGWHIAAAFKVSFLLKFYELNQVQYITYWCKHNNNGNNVKRNWIILLNIINLKRKKKCITLFGLSVDISFCTQLIKFSPWSQWWGWHIYKR